MIKFSILIPAFKKKFLKEAISSCLAQTYSHFEVIIVDDCSPEDLKSVVDAFDDSRIYYFRNERNYGAINVVDNWNTCLDFSTGDYVICIGDDDMLAPAALREYVCLINKYPKVDLLHSRTLIVDENSDPIELTLARPELEDQYSFMYAYRLPSE